MAAKKAPQHPLMLDGKSWNRLAVMAIVCERIASSSRSIATILAEPYEGNRLPDYTAIMDWLREDADIAHQYACAKEAQADWMAEEMIEIADVSRVGKKTTIKSNGDTEEVTSDMVDRARLQVETRKWLMGKLRPKKYGDTSKLQVGGDPNGPPIGVAVDTSALMAALEAKLASTDKNN